MKMTSNEKIKLVYSISSLKTLFDSMEIEDPELTISIEGKTTKFKVLTFLEEEVKKIVQESKEEE